MQVEVVYIVDKAQYSEVIGIPIETPLNVITVRDAVFTLILRNPNLRKYSDIQDWENRVGVFGERVSPDTIIKEGDRIEIYRDLKSDPREARRQRVAEVIKALAREKSKPKIKKKKWETPT